MEITINADDFGMNTNCTDAIFECFEKGLIDTTTLMCNQPAFEYAVNKVQKTDYKDKVGIHLVLTQGTPLTESIKYNANFCDNGLFRRNTNIHRRFTEKDKEDVYCELKAQFEKYLSTGLGIHHIDSHHHVHTIRDVLPIVNRLMEEYRVNSLRIFGNIGQINPCKRFIKNLHNRNLKSNGIAYSDLFGDYLDLMNFKGNRGRKMEIMCHPDYDSTGLLIDRRRYESTVACGESLVDMHKRVDSILAKAKQ